MRVGLGVSAGIAAYKAAELLRLLQDKGLEVQVIMTHAARQFVTPLTFAALSGRKVITDIFEAAGQEPNVESAIEHIAVAESIDALVIAPATAGILAKMAHGLADDFLSTLYLATRAPVIVAPAMNVNMWEHAATQANLEVLKSRGVRVVEPESGSLACGMVGAGRLAAVEGIASAVLQALHVSDDLAGEVTLVTAGPTEELIDPVRYLSNRSSGKMGYALAEAARRRGARVILVTGPVALEPPAGVEVERVRSTHEMAEAVLRRLNEATVVMMAAAASDYQSAEVRAEKIKKQNGTLSLTLKPTRDILSEIAARRRPEQIIVGFAAETANVVAYATQKLRAKNLDLIVANDVTQEGAGFGVDTNIVTLIFPDGRVQPLARMRKIEVAHQVLNVLPEIRRSSLLPKNASVPR
ncbi:MAG TPA: bifunctional phosphopantothenoylcysteine decarboxylase/phosphopantothenate--cysteine ligase CoaBC [Terriglobia bacterium]|nr:bifunctional phosphopantothenoylcysteine decarboxylase/phosphopantothenate--cysteine ligase CoaBC [Terriglobia bacterium]